VNKFNRKDENLPQRAQKSHKARSAQEKNFASFAVKTSFAPSFLPLRQRERKNFCDLFALCG
jgi:hypothetical protein